MITCHSISRTNEDKPIIFEHRDRHLNENIFAGMVIRKPNGFQIAGFRNESAGENTLRAVEAAQTKAKQTKPELMRVANTTRGRPWCLSHPGTASFAQLPLDFLEHVFYNHYRTHVLITRNVYTDRW